MDVLIYCFPESAERHVSTLVNSKFNNKQILGHMSDNGANLMVKFNPRFIEQNLAVNLEMPLTSFDHYCVSVLEYINCRYSTIIIQ